MASPGETGRSPVSLDRTDSVVTARAHLAFSVPQHLSVLCAEQLLLEGLRSSTYPLMKCVVKMTRPHDARGQIDCWITVYFADRVSMDEWSSAVEKGNLDDVVNVANTDWTANTAARVFLQGAGKDLLPWVGGRYHSGGDVRVAYHVTYDKYQEIKIV